MDSAQVSETMQAVLCNSQYTAMLVQETQHRLHTGVSGTCQCDCKKGGKISTEGINRSLLSLLSYKRIFDPGVVKTETADSISDKEDSLKIWRAAKNKFYEQVQTAVIICSSHIVVGHGG
jgi:hypothetical protein